MTATADSWRREPFTNGVALRYRASFDEAEFARLREGLVPVVMEDKWFVYYDEPYLFFHRSWTGLPVYRIELKVTPAGAKVVEALWSTQLADAPGADLEYEAKLLDFLLRNLLLGQSRPFPRPAGLVEPMPGVFQHHVSGTGYPESPPRQDKRLHKPWWRFW
ncbi:MAG TPA: hypothetical protein VF092_09705 [Longimicrobium sp.]